MKIVFLGTPDFGVPCLKALINSKHKVVAVVTQPDKPSGRNKKIEFSPIKKVALENNIPVLQYARISKEGTQDLTNLQPDIMITAAYGQILRQCILDIAKFGIINVHASLLPKFRGAAPIQWAVIKGEKVSGITIMKTELGVDTGDIILQKELPVGDTETAGELYNKLSNFAPELLLNALSQIENCTVKYVSQNHEEMSYFPMIKKEDAQIDFNLSAVDVVNFVRGMNPFPTAFTILNGGILKVFKAECANLNFDKFVTALNGQIILANFKQGLFVKCGDGKIVKLKQIQVQNGKKMLSEQYLLGHKINAGEMLGAVNAKV
ncbi:MAG: methionyl-tRNA formyltransferase [Clostridia bacterium]|nr:methionyl-tRNA formyltransferase [Clostridia bacterium]